MIRRILTVSAGLVLTAWVSMARAADYVWLEGEAQTAASVDVQRSGWGNAQFLSGEKWLHCSIEADKVEKEVPADGVLLKYEFRAREGGDVSSLEPHRVRVRALALRVADRRRPVEEGLAGRPDHRPDGDGLLVRGGLAEAGRGGP